MYHHNKVNALERFAVQMQKFKKNRKKEYESTKVSLFMNTCNQPLSPNSEFNSLFHILTWFIFSGLRFSFYQLAILKINMEMN